MLKLVIIPNSKIQVKINLFVYPKLMFFNHLQQYIYEWVILEPTI